MKRICFFSSDARPLYKKDIFRVLALPSGYTIQFRYQIKYVDLDMDKLSSYKNQICIIFFTSGNTTQNPDKLTNTSIREGIIEDIVKDDDTGLVLFFLKLKSFKDFVLGSNLDSKLPPFKFAVELEGAEGKIKQWHEIISDIKGSFPHQLMYKFNFTKYNSKKEIEPKFNNTDFQSYYLFEDENSYTLHVAFYDTTSADENIYQSIKFEQNGELLKINAPQVIEIGAFKDNKSFNVFTNSLNSNNSFTYLNFNSNNNDSKSSKEEMYNVEIQIQINKNKKRSRDFAMYSILAAISLGFGKVVTEKISIDGVFNLKLTIFIILINYINSSIKNNGKQT